MNGVDRWDMYFAAIASIQFHPANHLLDKTEEQQFEMLAQCAYLADMMIELRETHDQIEEQ